MPTSAMSTECKYHVLPFQHGGKSFQLWWSPHYIFGQDYQEAKSHLTEVYCWLSVMDTLVWFGPIGTHRNSVDRYFTLQRQSQRRNTTEKTTTVVLNALKTYHENWIGNSPFSIFASNSFQRSGLIKLRHQRVASRCRLRIALKALY